MLGNPRRALNVAMTLILAMATAIVVAGAVTGRDRLLLIAAPLFTLVAVFSAASRSLQVRALADGVAPPMPRRWAVVLVGLVVMAGAALGLFASLRTLHR